MTETPLDSDAVKGNMSLSHVRKDIEDLKHVVALLVAALTRPYPVHLDDREDVKEILERWHK